MGRAGRDEQEQLPLSRGGKLPAGTGVPHVPPALATSRGRLCFLQRGPGIGLSGSVAMHSPVQKAPFSLLVQIKSLALQGMTEV